MKKIFAILLCVTMVFSLAACSGQNEQSSQGSGGSDSAAEESTQQDNSSRLTEPSGESSDTASSEALSENLSETSGAEAAQSTGMSGGKTLVVYYSATNNTEAVAGYIADAMGADLFELVPVEPYTSDDLDWTNRDSRVSREHDDESLRVVELTNAVPDNWDEYDTVFIGYPIWWGIAAWPVDGFISANDFTGKTVIPFCTSSSSGLGESGELLRDAAGTGDWLEGQRFQSRVSEEEVKEWVSGLEL